MARIFVADGREFPDPDPSLSVADVQKALADFMPELHNAEVKQSKRPSTTNPAETDDVYELAKRVGTKG